MQQATPPPESYAGLTCVAAAMISVPGTIGYAALLIGLLATGADLSGNLMAPMILATAGLALFLLAGLGVATGLYQKLSNPVDPHVVRQASSRSKNATSRLRRHDPRASRRLFTICLWLNSLALAALIALVLFFPQFE